MFKIDMNKISEEVKKKENAYKNVFGKDFLSRMADFFYCSEKIADVSSDEQSDFLFRKFDKDNEIKPIFEYREKETRAEKTRPGRNAIDTYGVYHFNYPNIVFSKPAEILITRVKKDVPKELLTISNSKCVVDIEFFERNRLVDDSRNSELEEYLKFYAENEKCDLDDLKHMMSLRDVDKIHLKFLVTGDDSYKPIFIGIGTNEVYSIREKKRERKIDSSTRYYKYDLEEMIEQTIKIREVGDYINFDKFTLIFSEQVTLKDEYALDDRFGVIKKVGKGWKKIQIDVQKKELLLEEELKKKKNLKDIVKKIFPDFERYKYIAYDPLEKVLSYGHEKTIRHLIKYEVLGEGYQSKLNVASDLYLNSYDSVFRLKMISALLYNFIDSGELDKIIRDVVNAKESMPKQ